MAIRNRDNAIISFCLRDFASISLNFVICGPSVEIGVWEHPTTGDHEGPPHAAPPPSPLRTGEGRDQSGPTEVLSRGWGSPLIVQSVKANRPESPRDA